MLAAIAAFGIGAMVGLVLRPVLDAYLMWKTAELYRTSGNRPVDSGHPARPPR